MQNLAPIAFISNICNTPEPCPRRGGKAHCGGLLPHEVRYDVHGQWEDDGRVLLCRDGVESLQVAELQGRWGLCDHEGGLLQSTGCVHLTLGGDHLPGDTGRAGCWVNREQLLTGHTVGVMSECAQP